MELYDYVFHFNSYTQLWSAIPRDSLTNYWNGKVDERILSSKDIHTLFDLLARGQDFIDSVSREDTKNWCCWITVEKEEPSQSKITDYCFDNNIKLVSFLKQPHVTLINGEIVPINTRAFNWYIKAQAGHSSIENFKKYLMDMPEVSSFFEEIEEE